jgi:hypothetical protein
MHDEADWFCLQLVLASIPQIGSTFSAYSQHPPLLADRAVCPLCVLCDNQLVDMRRGTIKLIRQRHRTIHDDSVETGITGQFYAAVIDVKRITIIRNMLMPPGIGIEE